MKYFDQFVWLSLGLADLSLVLGILAKIFGFVVFGLGPYSYFCFAALSLLYAIAISLTQIAMHTRKQFFKQQS